MRYLKKFLQYDTVLESLLLEKVLHLGEKMKDVLKNMKHPYAKYMLNMDHGDNLEDIDNSYIEYSPKLGMASWLPVNREVDFQTKQELPETEKWATKKRQDVSIGKVVAAVLKKTSTLVSESELEKFINEYKALQNPGNFKLVKGEDIKHYYSQDNYDWKNEFVGCSLYNSCMRHGNCESYFSVYVKNPNVSLCILLTDDDKIQGRAIIWHNAIIDGDAEVYMDRIYAVSDSVTDKFKSYAQSNGWYCKVKQGTESHTIKGKDIIEDPEIKVVLPDGDWENWKKPYMDTLRYFSYDNVNGKSVPVLFNYFIQNDTNWKHNWNETDGDYNINRSYIDPLKEIRDLASNVGLDFNKLVLVNPTKINGNPMIWKVNDKNILVMENVSNSLLSIIKRQDVVEKMKLEPFIADYETHALMRKIGPNILGLEFRSDIMLDMLENTDNYIGNMDTSNVRSYIQDTLQIQIITKEVTDNFNRLRDYIINSKPKTFGKLLNDEFEIGIDVHSENLKNEYYTKLKDDEKGIYYLTSIIESAYNDNNDSYSEAVVSLCNDYIRRVVLNNKNAVELYNEYIAEHRQRKMNFIEREFGELVQSVNTTYLLDKIKQSPENIRKFAVEYILTNNSPYFLVEQIVSSETELGKSTRMLYVQKWLQSSFDNPVVNDEVRGNKFCYFVDNLD